MTFFLPTSHLPMLLGSRLLTVRRLVTRQTVTMPITSVADLANLTILYETGGLTPVDPNAGTRPGPSAEPSQSLNDRVTLHRGDITALAVDAIVNAANKSLRGGGGVDGAIHRAAGPELLSACRALRGCPTGSAKITDAFLLPCKKVIHAVGPVYDHYMSETSEADLAGCYRTALQLAVDNGCASVAFCAISTGIYGYPSRAAAAVAISTVKAFLESKEGDDIKLVVFVVFEKKDSMAYKELLPYVCPARAAFGNQRFADMPG